MKKLRLIWIAFIIVFIGGCELFTGSDSEVEEPSDKKKFVWNAMNYWYYWQGEVRDLGDDRFKNEDEFYNYLNAFEDAEELFFGLQHPDDDFSFFIDDYEEYNREQDGVQAALGINYGFICKEGGCNEDSQAELVGYIRYVISGTPADEAGLERLDLFTKVDGNTIRMNNFNELLASNTAHDLTMARIDTTASQLFVEEETVTVSSREVKEDPVFKTEVIDTAGVKIGYLMYNFFSDSSAYHKRLNEEFDNFRSQGIDEMVLDLRYNGGGSVLTSQLLASLISGNSSSDKYAELDYNEKRSSNSRDLFFLDEVPLKNEEGQFENSEPINSLSLPSIYILTSNGTASASEAVINGLDPYIDVTIIGLKTVGKDEGSLTLYDKEAPYTWNKDDSGDSSPNPDHKKAIQPIVTKIVNSQGQDYPDGFEPDGYTPNGCADDPNDNCVNEITVENLMAKPVLGSPDEPLVSRAIDIILGQTSKQKRTPEMGFPKLREIEVKNGIQDLRPHGNGMYLEPFMMPPGDKR